MLSNQWGQSISRHAGDGRTKYAKSQNTQAQNTQGQNAQDWNNYTNEIFTSVLTQKISRR